MASRSTVTIVRALDGLRLVGTLVTPGRSLRTPSDPGPTPRQPTPVAQP